MDNLTRIDLLAPALLFFMAGIIRLAQDGETVSEYLFEYLINPALIYWLASLPAALAAWLVWRRNSFAVMPLLVIWALPCLAIIFIAVSFSTAGFDDSRGDWGWSVAQPHSMDDTAFDIARFMAPWSLILWLQLGIHHLVDRRHRRRGTAETLE